MSAVAVSEAPKITEVPKWAHDGEAVAHHAVQPDRLSGDERLHRITAPAVCRCRMQLIAKPFAEATLFQAGHAYEMAVGTRKRRPEMAMAEAAE